MASTIILSDNGASSGSAGLKSTAGNDGVLILQTTTSGGTATNAVYVDTSQNIGLGVAPSAWVTLGNGIQTKGAGYVMGRTDSVAQISVGLNNYYDGTNYLYSTSSYATQYQQYLGQHTWKIAPSWSGTGSNIIAFTQAMTLTAAGNLGVGTTSPGGTSVDRQVTFTGSTSSQLTLTGNASTINIGNNGTVSYLESVSTAPLTFYTNGSERARIDSNGTFKNVATLNYGLSSAVTAAAGTSTAVFIARYSATAGDTGSGTNSFIVWSNGNVVNTNNSYGAISDIKLKENITDTTPKLADLMQVRVRNYNLKNAPKQKQLGVIAQELEQVFPSMVDESPDRDTEGNDLGTTTKQVKYSVFVPMLIKAIQEQQALITTLTERITALENK